MDGNNDDTNQKDTKLQGVFTLKIASPEMANRDSRSVGRPTLDARTYLKSPSITSDQAKKYLQAYQQQDTTLPDIEKTLISLGLNGRSDSHHDSRFVQLHQNVAKLQSHISKIARSFNAVGWDQQNGDGKKFSDYIENLQEHLQILNARCQDPAILLLEDKRQLREEQDRLANYQKQVAAVGSSEQRKAAAQLQISSALQTIAELETQITESAASSSTNPDASERLYELFAEYLGSPQNEREATLKRIRTHLNQNGSAINTCITAKGDLTGAYPLQALFVFAKNSNLGTIPKLIEVLKQYSADFNVDVFPQATLLSKFASSTSSGLSQQDRENIVQSLLDNGAHDSRAMRMLSFGQKLKMFWNSIPTFRQPVQASLAQNTAQDDHSEAVRSYPGVTILVQENPDPQLQQGISESSPSLQNTRRSVGARSNIESLIPPHTESQLPHRYPGLDVNSIGAEQFPHIYQNAQTFVNAKSGAGWSLDPTSLSNKKSFTVRKGEQDVLEVIKTQDGVTNKIKNPQEAQDLLSHMLQHQLSCTQNPVVILKGTIQGPEQLEDIKVYLSSLIKEDIDIKDFKCNLQLDDKIKGDDKYQGLIEAQVSSNISNNKEFIKQLISTVEGIQSRLDPRLSASS